jgi:alkaline phosphatase
VFKKVNVISMILAACVLPVQAKNVILIIGDGMDDQQITAARNYLHGAQGKTILDTMPIRAAVQVITQDETDPNTAIYVADSANSATAMATGVSTSIGRIGTTANTDLDVKNLTELAIDKNYKVGVVTTAAITDATPAAFVAHVNQRGCQGPKRMLKYESYGDLVIDCAADTKANGGLGSISEQLADSQVDLLLGGGAKFFKSKNEEKSLNLIEHAQQNGFYVASDLPQAKNSPADKKLLGLFAKKHLPVRLQGTDGRVAESPEFSFLNLIHRYLGSVTLPDEMACEPNPEFSESNTPNLKDMSQLALERLANKDGFFLMIESASIDKQSHKRNPCGSIGEAEQLFETVELTLNFAKNNPDTLILVTADHGQAAQIIPNGSMFSAYGVPISTPGAIARIQTPEGGVMAINYATNEFSHEEHTGVNIPLFANKNINNKNGEPLITPLIQQKDIFTMVSTYLNL